jgi:hypothetical protein
VKTFNKNTSRDGEARAVLVAIGAQKTGHWCTVFCAFLFSHSKQLRTTQKFAQKTVHLMHNSMCGLPIFAASFSGSFSYAFSIEGEVASA